MRKASATVWLLAAVAAAPLRAEVNTGLLEREAGSVGEEVGASVIEVDRSMDGITVLDLRLPPLPEEVDRVEVLDSEGRVLEQLRPADIDSGDGKQTSVRVYLKPAPKVDVRLRLYDADEEDSRN